MCTFGKCNRDVSISTYANKQTATFCAKLLLSAADGDKHVGYFTFKSIFRVTVCRDDGRTVCSESVAGSSFRTTEPGGDRPRSRLSTWSGSVSGSPEPRCSLRNSSGKCKIRFSSPPRVSLILSK